MKFNIVFILFYFILFSGYGQLPILTKVQHNRAIEKAYEHAGIFDSALFCFSRYINNEKYTNPGDYLLYSMCSIKVKDTAGFTKYMSKAVAAGFELGAIHGYAKVLNSDELLFLNNFLDANYKPMRDAGYAGYDTVLINEVKLIMEMDQLVRTGWKNDANIKYRSFIGQQIDSINYERVKKLFESGKYPGYHNCGIYASDIMLIMMHSTDSHDDRFQYIFKKIKAEVLEGNISPVEIAIIADRHYTGTLTNPRSYYGHWQGRKADLYDCSNVDVFRAEIGLDDLKTEYEREHRPLPECYGKH